MSVELCRSVSNVFIFFVGYCIYICIFVLFKIEYDGVFMFVGDSMWCSLKYIRFVFKFFFNNIDCIRMLIRRMYFKFLMYIFK